MNNDGVETPDIQKDAEEVQKYSISVSLKNSEIIFLPLMHEASSRSNSSNKKCTQEYFCDFERAKTIS